LKRNRTTYLILTGFQVAFVIYFIALMVYLLYDLTDQFTELYSTGWVAVVMGILFISSMIVRNIYDNRKFKREMESSSEQNESQT